MFSEFLNSLKYSLYSTSNGDKVPWVFVCLGKTLSCLHFRYSILGWQVFSFSSFHYVISLICGLQSSSKKYADSSLGVLLYVTSCCFQNSLSSTFDNLIIMGFNTVFFVLILFGNIWALWIWMSISCLRFKKFLVTISLSKLSVPSPNHHLHIDFQQCIY